MLTLKRHSDVLHKQLRRKSFMKDKNDSIQNIQKVPKNW